MATTDNFWSLVSADEVRQLQDAIVYDDCAAVEDLQRQVGPARWCRLLLCGEVADWTDPDIAKSFECHADLAFGVAVDGSSKYHVKFVNPFYAAIFGRALKVARLLRGQLSDEQVCRLSQTDVMGYNLLHMTVASVHGAGKDSEEFDDFRRFVEEEMLTSEMALEMLDGVSVMSDKPLEMATRCGLFHSSRWLLRLRLRLQTPQEFWMRHHRMLQLGEYEPRATNSRVFASPLFFLLDEFDSDDFQTLAEHKVFRDNSIFRVWVDAKFRSVLAMTRVYLALSLAMLVSFTTLLTAAPLECLSSSADGSAASCDFKMWLCIALVAFTLISHAIEAVVSRVAIVRRRRWLQRQRRVGAVNSRGHGELTLLFLLSCCTVALSCSLLALYCSPQLSMRLSGRYATNIACWMAAGLILLVSYRIVVLLRLLEVAPFFFTCLLECLNNFLVFSVVQLVLIVVYGRLFASAFKAVKTVRNVTFADTGLSGDSAWSSTWTSTYWTFLLALNVLPDLDNFSPTAEHAVVNVLQLLFVFVVPIFFINIIVALMASQFSHVQQHFVEYTCMKKIGMLMYFDCVCHLVNSTTPIRIGGSDLCITVCRLLTATGSKVRGPRPDCRDGAKIELETLED